MGEAKRKNKIYMETKNEKVTIACCISHQDPEQFRKQLEAFSAEYEISLVEISTTVVMIGQGHGRAQALVIPSAYIEFICTQEKAREFKISQSFFATIKG